MQNEAGKCIMSSCPPTNPVPEYSNFHLGIQDDHQKKYTSIQPIKNIPFLQEEKESKEEKDPDDDHDHELNSSSAAPTQDSVEMSSRRNDVHAEAGVSSAHEALKEEESCSNGRERLKRHRVEVAGRVWIPEMWGQEDFLKDWIDCTAFDASIVGSSIMSARAALMEEGRGSSSCPRLRIENSC